MTSFQTEDRQLKARTVVNIFDNITSVSIVIELREKTNLESKSQAKVNRRKRR